VGNDGVLVHNGSGAYRINFDDGTCYVGKGDKSRYEESKRRILKKKPKVKVLPCSKHHPGPLNDRDSFILEDELIEQIQNSGECDLLNKINSPGRRYRGR